MFNALVLNRIEDQKATGEVKEINISDLPEGDVLVKIDYSTINYKDSLAITSSSPIIKIFLWYLALILQGRWKRVQTIILLLEIK